MGLLGIVVVGVMSFWFLASIILLVSRHRKGFLKLGMKEVAQSFLQLVGIAWLCLLLCLGIVLIRPLVSYLEGLEPYSSIFTSLPFVYTAGLLLVWSVLLGKILSWRFNYTDDEKEFLREANLRMRRRLGPLGRFVKVDGTASKT